MKRAYIFALTLVVFTYLPVSATIINIPDDYLTIQEGIDASTDGDTVLVQPGTYVENINFNGHNIVLGSLFLTTGDTTYIAETVIDGDRSEVVILFNNSENDDAIVCGFSIKNGCVGIKSIDSGPIILNNVIYENYKIGDEGPIYAGGVLCQDSNAKVLNNTIRDNWARTFNDYGGAYGFGIHSTNSTLRIEGNIIYDNAVYGPVSSASGIGCSYSDVTIVNNTISRNRGANHDSYCYGIGLSSSNSSINVINTICWLNTHFEVASHNSEISMQYCDIYRGYEGEGNIDLNPVFIEPSTDNYNVYDISPCINAGHPDIIDPDGTRSDIGAYFNYHPEFNQSCLLYVAVDGSDETGEGSIEHPYRTIQYAIEESNNYDTVLVLPGEYTENIRIYNKDIRLSSNYIFSGDSADIYETVHWSQFASQGNIIFELCDDLAIVEGFTLGHMDATGSAIMCSYAHPRIRNNIIVNNHAYGFGGGIRLQYSNPEVSHNIIRNNIATINGGGIYCYYSNPVIDGNLIYDNEAAYYGGGIVCHISSPTIINSMIVNNRASEGGGIYCSPQQAHPVIMNSIIWYNYESNISGPIISYSNIQGGYEGEGNISSDPLFRDPENGDFHLMSTDCGDPEDSPCIDAGHPDILDSLLDCSWGLGALRSDMGAYGGGDSTMVGIDDDKQPEVPIRFGLSQNYPNPFNTSTVIHYQIPVTSDVTIVIYDILGRKAETLVNKEQPAGYHQVVWDGSDHSSGMYFYWIEAGEYSDTKKMVLLK